MAPASGPAAARLRWEGGAAPMEVVVHSSIRSFLPALAVVSLLSTSPLVAQLTPPATPPPLPGSLSADVVVTAEAAPAGTSALGVATTVLDRAEIERRQQSTLLELLRTVPGLDVVQSGGPGGVTSLFLRGTTSTQTLVLLDGARLNSPYFGGVDLSSVSTANVDRIEVVRGPFSALWGSEAVGGVIRIFTKRGGSPGLSAKGTASYGTASTREGTLSAAWSDGTVDVSAGFRRLLSDGDLPNGHFSTTSLSGAVDVLVSDDVRVGASIRRETGETGVPFVGETATPRRKTFSDTTSVTVPVSVTLGKGTSLEAAASLVGDDPRFEDPDDPWGFTSSETEARRQQGRVVVSQEWSRHRLSVGADYERTKVTNRDTYGLQLDGETTSTWSVFAEDRLSLLDDRLAITAGLRRDEHSAFGGSVNPRVAVSWRISDAVKLRAAGGSAFRSPSTGELYYPFSGNPDLDPERSVSWEGGAEWSLGAGAVLEATVFATDVKDLIQYDFASQHNVNVGQARLRGVEAVLRGTLAPNVFARASYTYLDAVDRETGLPLLRRPRHRASGTVGYATKRANAELTGTWVGARDDVDAATFARVVDPSYFRLDAAVTIPRLLGAFGPFARVTNVLGKEYVEVAGFPSPGRRVTVGLDLTY